MVAKTIYIAEVIAHRYMLTGVVIQLIIHQSRRYPMFKQIICFSLLLCSFRCYAQTSNIDTLSFSLEKKLLVFKGKLNGAEVDFAFDTGAEIGVLNSANQVVAKCDIGSNKKRVKDANNKTVKGQKISIEKLTIGSFEFEDVRSLYADMEFLQCNQLYLLGQNVISKLNWRFDFTNHSVLVSESPFSIDSSFTQLPVTGSSKRPFTEFALGSKKVNRCLIDFGYTGILDFPESDLINSFYYGSASSGSTTIGLYSNMGLGGLGDPDTLKSVKLHEFVLGGLHFADVLVSIPEKASLKIGVGFFSKYCNQVILNHTTGAYYVHPNPQPPTFSAVSDARISMVAGKLLVTGKSLSANSTASALQIGEEIKTIAGKSALDFPQPCDFFNWFTFLPLAEIEIEKITGEKVVVKRGWIK